MAKHSANNGHKRASDDPNFGDWVNDNSLLIGFTIGALFLIVVGIRVVGDGISQITSWFASADRAMSEAIGLLIPQL